MWKRGKKETPSNVHDRLERQEGEANTSNVRKPRVGKGGEGEPAPSKRSRPIEKEPPRSISQNRDKEQNRKAVLSPKSQGEEKTHVSTAR